MEYGLIGHPLGHSFSKEIHESITDYIYELCDIDENEIDAFMKSRDFKAINVTIPYKQTVMPYLYEIDEKASQIGAVNTIVNRDGRLYGYNTDLYGLKELILRNTDSLKGKTVLILGSGGTSKTAAFVSKILGAGKIYKATRKDLRSPSDFDYIKYDELYRISDSVDVMINTTPVGMYPNVHSSAVDVGDFKNLGCVIDVVYNPLRTKLVSDAKKLGIPAEGGLYMLVSQAVYAIEHFLGCSIHDEVKEEAYKSVLMKRENIVLSGMPGSGKSSVGKIIAETTGKRFIDTDELISQRYGDTAEIIRTKGEKAFRDIETEVISSITGEVGCVIATGGGAILRDENVDYLKRNGRIVFLDRDIDEIVPTENRPLSSDREQLIKRYEERFGRYNETSDLHITSSGEEPEETARRIIEETRK